eukprot:654050-Pelagomonas_calceolata.AAC.2
MASCLVCAAPASIYCQQDNAFLCLGCDASIHSANLLSSRHTRLPCCDLCHRQVASVWCKEDAAHLCNVCDGEVHASNPIPHDRVAVKPISSPCSNATVRGAGCTVDCGVGRSGRSTNVVRSGDEARTLSSNVPLLPFPHCAVLPPPSKHAHTGPRLPCSLRLGTRGSGGARPPDGGQQLRVREVPPRAIPRRAGRAEGGLLRGALRRRGARDARAS